MELLLVLLVLAVAVLFITGPLRRASATTNDDVQPPVRVELEAAKEAKYREIRDAELDYRTGKLSHDDWQRLDATLRAEAVTLLDRIDAIEERGDSCDRD
jgi:hypothetical protein